MLRQASRLSIRMTGRMPVPPAIPKAARLLPPFLNGDAMTGLGLLVRNDILCY